LDRAGIKANLNLAKETLSKKDEEAVKYLKFRGGDCWVAGPELEIARLVCNRAQVGRLQVKQIHFKA